MGFLPQPITLQSLFGKDRKIGGITVNVVINESTNDTLTITKQPVQQGASMTDHSYKEPTALSMTAHLKDNGFFTALSELNPFGGGAQGSLASLYKDLLDLQATRQPFDIITPKRVYKSMLMATLSVTTDKATENILSVNFSFQEVLIVSVGTTFVERGLQKLPGVTGATEPAGKKSAALSLSEGIGGLFRR